MEDDGLGLQMMDLAASYRCRKCGFQSSTSVNMISDNFGISARNSKIVNENRKSELMLNTTRSLFYSKVVHSATTRYFCFREFYVAYLIRSINSRFYKTARLKRKTKFYVTGQTKNELKGRWGFHKFVIESLARGEST